MTDVVNVAAYRFARLENPASWRETLRRTAAELGLKGTILLSHEGINLFLAGSAAALQTMLGVVRGIPGFADLPAKFSPSTNQPFTRLLVRLKKEIIAFGRDEIDPLRETVPAISPRELKAWLDQGRPLTLLDVRNDYEIELGTFRSARPAEIDHFRDFPQAVQRLAPELSQRPVVMFCTGGIRCEKAGPYLRRQGIAEVYQLEGGILKYFEEVGGAHYDGACFVFDQRVALGPDLQPVGYALCFACQAALSPTEQKSPQFVLGMSCPRCYIAPAARAEHNLRQREAELARVTTPLPGLQPYVNRRPVHVGGRFAGTPLLEFLTAAIPSLSREEWLNEIQVGRVVEQDRALSADERVRDGQRLAHLQPETVEPPVATTVRWLFEDDALIVVDKPAPLPIHPCGRFHRHSLTFFLNLVHAPLFPRPQHRLDAETTGVVVLAKTRRVANALRIQFENQNVAKLYLARLSAAPRDREFEIDLPIAAEPNAAGLRAIDSLGKASRTRGGILRRFADGTALAWLRPVTGRTNQLRVHLAERGWAIVGDRWYGGTAGGAADGGGEADAPAEPAVNPLQLCHYRLRLHHPLTGQPVEFTAHIPAWLSDFDPSELPDD